MAKNTPKTVFLLSTVFFFCLDSWIKRIVLCALPVHQPIAVINRVLYLNLTYNTGAAFGIMPGKNNFLIAISCLFSIGLVIWVLKSRLGVLDSIFLSMVFSGALSNLKDRIVFGCVVDYIDFRVWPVFNLADTLITLGCVSYIVSLSFVGKK